MDEHQRRLHPLVDQIGEVPGQLRRRQHSLVDERARREARQREVGPGGELGNAADDVQLPLERVLVGRQLGRRADDELAHARGVDVGALADVPVVDRDVAPGNHALPLGLDGGDQELLELGPARVVLREEAHPDAVLPGRRQVVADHAADEAVGHLQQDPGAVPGRRVCAGGAAMLEVGHGAQPARDRLVRGHAVQAGDERDTAGVVLEGRVVQADRLGRPRPHAVCPSPVWCALVRWCERGEPASAVAGARQKWSRWPYRASTWSARRTCASKSKGTGGNAQSRAQHSTPRGRYRLTDRAGSGNTAKPEAMTTATDTHSAAPLSVAARGLISVIVVSILPL